MECGYVTQRRKGCHWKFNYDAILKGEKYLTKADTDRLKWLYEMGQEEQSETMVKVTHSSNCTVRWDACLEEVLNG